MSTLPDLTGKRVAIIASSYFEEAELVTPRDQLHDAGADVRVYGPDGEPLQAMEGDTDKTITVEVDGTFADLDPSAIDVLVVPGGTVNADTLRTNPEAQQIVRSVVAAGTPLAAICHAPWLLVSAGLVDGRRLTSYPSLADDIRNAGGDWVDEEVVEDAPFITSRNPDDIPAFVAAIGAALTR
jgi:protease I